MDVMTFRCEQPRSHKCPHTVAEHEPWKTAGAGPGTIVRMWAIEIVEHPLQVGFEVFEPIDISLASAGCAMAPEVDGAGGDAVCVEHFAGGQVAITVIAKARHDDDHGDTNTRAPFVQGERRGAIVFQYGGSKIGQLRLQNLSCRNRGLVPRVRCAASAWSR